MHNLAELARNARMYDLAQPYFVGMPHFPTHPPFLYSLTKKHGDLVTDNGGSSAADSLALGGHVGTHIDALCHFSQSGKLHGGIAVEPIQSYGNGIEQLSIDTVPPIVRRGILLDIAGMEGPEPLAADFAITTEHLDGALERAAVECEPGDVVLIRTGWAQFWNNPPRYITGGKGSAVSGPGPQLEAAQWLSSKKIFAAGSDTIAFEKMPSPGMDVHLHLLVESGIHIIEALNLEDLAREEVHEFLFVALPLKLRGATGSPIRPVALA